MGYRLTKIYTRTGDDGKTNLGDKNRIPKNHIRVEALGTLDELNSAIGLILSLEPIEQKIFNYLNKVQNDLFNVGAELCPPYPTFIQAEDIIDLEKKIDELNTVLPPLTEFILPRGTPATAASHFARTVCRRAERILVTLDQTDRLRTELICFINRLSDLLFVIARTLAKDHNTEVLWKQ